MARRKKKRAKRTTTANPSIFRRARSAPPRKQLAPGSPFNRVAPPPTFFPEGSPTGPFGSFGISPLGPVPEIDWNAIDEMARNNVFDELVRMDVDPAIAAELSRIDPDGWYVVIATVRGGSASDGAPEERRGQSITNRIVLVGRGVRLWGRFLHICDPDGGGSTLVDVTIHAMRPGDPNGEEVFPLWSGQTVTTIDGLTVEGSGDRERWLSRRPEPRKRGPRRKSGGGMNADERRAEKKRQRERDRREKKTRERRYALEDAKDVVGANRLRKKRDAALKRSKRKTKPGKGRTR